MIVDGSRQHGVAANVKVACKMQRLPRSNYLGQKKKLEMQPDKKYCIFCFSKKLGFQPCQFQVQIGVSQSEGGLVTRQQMDGIFCAARGFLKIGIPKSYGL